MNFKEGNRVLVKIKRQHFVFFWFAVVCSVISSLSLLAAVLVNNEGKYKAILMAFGFIAWIGLILEQVFFWKANQFMKKAMRKEKYRIVGRVGILSVFGCIEGLIADIVFFVSVIAFIVCAATGYGVDFIQYICICLIVLSFRLHCFLNGRNYKYIKKEGRA